MEDNNDRYETMLKQVVKEDDGIKIPDRVKEYTHDINGNKLPMSFLQLNEQLVFHLNKIPAHIKAKNDYFGLCFGYPGVGKSHLLQRVAFYLTANFSLKDIVFTPAQLDEWVATAKEGSVGVFDEADVISDNHNSNILKGLIRNSKRIRTKKLIIFVATPTSKDMHHYFAFRAKMLIYSFVPKNTPPDNRGYFHLWHDQDLISDLFARMKKAYSENSRVYNESFCTLKNKYLGRKIPSDWPINEKEYEDKKEAARLELEESDGLTPTGALRKYRKEIIPRFEELKANLKESLDYGLTQLEMCKVLGIGKRTYQGILQEVRKQ